MAAGFASELGDVRSLYWNQKHCPGQVSKKKEAYWLFNGNSSVTERLEKAHPLRGTADVEVSRGAPGGKPNHNLYLSHELALMKSSGRDFPFLVLFVCLFRDKFSFNLRMASDVWWSWAGLELLPHTLTARIMGVCSHTCGPGD